jgi:hypothetical protein
MLLGLNGQIGAGKDAVYERALALADALPGTPSPERVAFADKLKLAAARALGVSVDTLESLKRDDNAVITLRSLHSQTTDVYSEITVRQYLQYVGTEVGRETFGETFWVDQTLPPDLDHTGRLIIATDVRFPNEAQRIRELGGLVVRVTNGPFNEAGHASEQILDADLIDFEIDNSNRDDNYASLDEAVTDTLQLLYNGETVTDPLPMIWN